MSNSMQSHFNDDEKEDDSGGTIYITGDQMNCVDTIFQDSNVTLRWNTDTDAMEYQNYPTLEDFEEHKSEVNDRLSAIEDQMAIVRRDAILEEDFEELREAWQAYNDLMDKLRTFKALQDSA